jgi:hypothetical protein
MAMNLVWRFEQGKHLPKGNKGVCMQLVAYWVSMMHHHKADNDTASAKMASLCQAEALKLQNAYSKAGKDQAVGADEAVSWNVRKMRLRDGVYTKCADTTEIVSFMDEKRQGYSLGIYFSAGGGHALGFWRSGSSDGLFSRFSGHTYFFDPNVGCLKGDTSAFPSYLAGFFQADPLYATTSKMEMAKVDEAIAPRAHAHGAFKYV